jgi:hypothetical protein
MKLLAISWFLWLVLWALQVCHVEDIKHEVYKCKFPCERTCVKNGHGCPDKCFVEPCPRCKVLVETTLPCNHTLRLPCYIDTTTYNCLEEVVRTLACGHETAMLCYQDPNMFDCLVDVLKTLPCTHEQTAFCHEPVELVNCVTDVSVTIQDCQHEVSTIICLLNAGLLGLNHGLNHLIFFKKTLL